jgi:hypothetical protein
VGVTDDAKVLVGVLVLVVDLVAVPVISIVCFEGSSVEDVLVVLAAAIGEGT